MLYWFDILFYVRVNGILVGIISLKNFKEWGLCCGTGRCLEGYVYLNYLGFFFFV